MLKKAIALLLIVLMLCPSAVLSTQAAESKFIGIEVANRSNDFVETEQEVFFTDGTHIYATPGFFEKYTLFEYDVDNSAFVRQGQAFKGALSKVGINVEAKSAEVTMFAQKKQIKLADVITKGNDIYLPVDQMTALLKAKISFKNDVLYISNGGISIADAAYKYNAYSEIMGYSELVDEVFAGREDLMFYYTAIGYFSSTIFDLKIKNLDFITHSGDTDVYKSILEDCVTDNSEYLKTQASDKAFLKRLTNAEAFSGTMVKLLKKGRQLTTVTTTAYENFTDTSDIHNLDLEYIQADNWGGVYKKLSKSFSYVQYFTKLAAMNQDNKTMLNQCYDDLKRAGITGNMKSAIVQTNQKFGKDVLTSLTQKVGEDLVKELPDKAVKTYAADAVPYLAVIKGVAAAFKLMGVDLTDNSAFEVMLEQAVESEMADRYSDFYESAGKTKKSSEQFRLAAIFMLLSYKHAYEKGNALNKKISESESSYFNKQLNNICARLNMFYRAVESREFDNVEGIDSLIEANQNAIEKSRIIQNAQEIIPFADTSIGKRLVNGSWSTTENLNTGLMEKYTFSKNGNVRVDYVTEMQEGKGSAKCKVIDDSTVVFKVKYDSGNVNTCTVSLFKGSELLKCVYDNDQVNNYHTLMYQNNSIDYEGASVELASILVGNTWKFSSGTPYSKLKIEKTDTGGLKGTLTLQNGKRVDDILMFAYSPKMGRMFLSDGKGEKITNIIFEKESDNKLKLYYVDTQTGEEDLDYATLTK